MDQVKIDEEIEGNKAKRLMNKERKKELYWKKKEEERAVLDV